MARLKAALLISLFLFSADLTYADIGVICTLKGERDQILKDLRIEDTVLIAERKFYKGSAGNTKVVLVRSFMGKVNNAITAQLLASHFNVDMIVSVGFGGAVDTELKIGDVVVSSDAIQHDFGTIKPYGFIWGKSPEIGENRNINVEKWAISKGYYYGTIASGDQFIASKEKRTWIKRKFNASAVDMGAAAINEVCRQNGIDCVFLRIISDGADIEGRINFNKSAQAEKYESVNVLREFIGNYDNLPMRR